MTRPSSTVAEPGAVAPLRVVRSLDRDRWTAFVERHPEASIFHTPEMHDVFESTRQHRPDVWATVDERGRIRALFAPVRITSYGGALRPLTTRAVSFAGPLVDGGTDDLRCLEGLLAAYRKRSGRDAVFTEIRNVVDASARTPSFAACGFRHEPHLNFLLDLRPDIAQLWKLVAPSAQRNVRKARRLGLTVEEVEADAIDAAYAILRDVYHRIRVPLPDRSLFHAADRILRPLGRFQVLMARLDDRPIGVLTLLMYRGVATYWYTGGLRQGTRTRAGDLLAWTAIETARDRGCHTFDFGGAGRPDEPYGVRDFKAKYGGVLVDHGRELLVHAPIRMRLATRGYELVRRFL